jgi:hypothetical protein
MTVCKTIRIILLALLFTSPAFGQDDLMSMLEEEAAQEQEFTLATFKAPRLIQAHSIEQPAKTNLLFIIAHRFGQLNGGFYEVFGLDQATMRIGLDYGVTNRISIGLGRSTYQKNYDAFAKVKVLQQATGQGASPISLSAFSSISLNSLRWADPNRENYFSSRLAFTHQVLIARKMNPSISLQLMPTLVHKNLVPGAAQTNDIFALGTGGRLKLTDRVSLLGEGWFFLTPKNQLPTVNNLPARESLSCGVELETGGHVFQFQLSNSQGMFEKAFITETIGQWGQGGIHFGFNITRTFALKRE